MKNNRFHKILATLTATAALMLLLSGCAGINGAVGEQGDRGEQGVQGEDGVQGIPGLPGNPENFAVIVYDTNGGSTISPGIVEKGKELPLPTPERFAYDFEGWYTGAGLDRREVISGECAEDNLTLVAKWSPKAVLWDVSNNRGVGNNTYVEFYHPEEVKEVYLLSEGEQISFEDAADAGLISSSHTFEKSGAIYEAKIRLYVPGEYSLRVVSTSGKVSDLPIGYQDFKFYGAHICDEGWFNGALYQSTVDPVISVIQSELLGEPLELEFDMPYDMTAVSAKNNGTDIDVLSAERSGSTSFVVSVDTSSLAPGENKIEVKVNHPTYGEASALWTINVIAETPVENTVLYTENCYDATHVKSFSEIFEWSIWCVDIEEVKPLFNLAYNWNIVDESGETVKYVNGNDVVFRASASISGNILNADFLLDSPHKNDEYLAPGKYKVTAEVFTPNGDLIASSEFDYHVRDYFTFNECFEFGEEAIFSDSINEEVESLFVNGIKLLPGEQKEIPYANASVLAKLTVADGVSTLEFTVNADFTDSEYDELDFSVIINTADGVKYYSSMETSVISVEVSEIARRSYLQIFEGYIYIIETYFSEFLTGEDAVAELVALYDFVKADKSEMTYADLQKYIYSDEFYELELAAVDAFAALGALPEGKNWYDPMYEAQEAILANTGFTKEMLYNLGPFANNMNPEYITRENTYQMQIQSAFPLASYFTENGYDLAESVIGRMYNMTVRAAEANPEFIGWYLELNEMEKAAIIATATNDASAAELRAEFAEKTMKLYTILAYMTV